MSGKVVTCEFAEKTYETRANAELVQMASCRFCCWRSHRVQLWAPGQVAEKYLGFDVAVSLQAAPPRLLMKLLNTALPPGFDIRDFHQGTGTNSAPKVASLFLQYKRSDRVLKGSSAKGARCFNRQPYFRFKLDTDQHGQLEKLAAAAAGQALVRYAAPLFHTNQEFVDCTLNDGVLGRSRFLDVNTPSSPGGQHSYAAFDARHAYFCSEPEPVDSEDLELLFSRAGQVQGVPAKGHIRYLAAAVRAISDSREIADSTDDQTDSVERDFWLIAKFAARNRLQWWMSTQ